MSQVTGSRRRRPGAVEVAPKRTRARQRVRRPEAGEECRSEVTLESKMLTMWAALTAGYPVECPVCSGPLTAADGCSRCGTRIG